MFSDFEKTLDVPYVMYADFESSLVAVNKEEQQCGESTQRLNQHVANSFKVRDHCHITNQYRGAAHSICNLKVRTNYKIPVFIHNLKGYDAHLLMTAMGITEGKINVIATNTEKYVAFSLDNLVFKDSCQFMQKSLDSVAKTLKFEQTELPSITP